MKSKALKPNNRYTRVARWWDNVVDAWDYWWWKILGNSIHQIKRMWQWYWNVFRYDYDFDGHCLFAIIEYKLKRIGNSLRDGLAIQEDRDMRALRVAIKLAGRLKDDKYANRCHRKIEEKWGDLRMSSIPCNDGSGNSTCLFSRPKAVSDSQKAQELTESRNAYITEAWQQKRDEKRLYGILEKYLRGWWD